MQNLYEEHLALLKEMVGLLREISGSLKPKSAPVQKRKIKKDEGLMEEQRLFIQTYCDAFKKRYGTYPLIDYKALGVAFNMIKQLPIERITVLIQAYLQMEDRWFLTKCHDLVTFSTNINKVAVALYHGTADPHEKSYWLKVFGGEDGSANLPAANDPTVPELGRAQLQSGESGTPVESIPEHKR